MSEMTVSDARAQLADAIEAARRGDAVFLTRHGEAVAVLLDVEEYDRLVDAAEYEEDVRAIKRARREGDWIPWEQVKADLGLE